ncbi:hypothetical protein PC120_g19667 [Phytophthora cactorum]|nr:hypothetical protein PC120_g19667 [Phytophthora cactorum]
MVAALIETVNELLESEAAQKLAERNAATIQELKPLHGEYIQKRTDDTEVGKALAERTEKKLTLEGLIVLPEFEVLNGFGSNILLLLLQLVRTRASKVEVWNVVHEYLPKDPTLRVAAQTVLIIGVVGGLKLESFVHFIIVL